MSRTALTLMLVAACSDSPPAFDLVVDVPEESSAAFPYGGLSTLTLSIARAGNETDIQSTTAVLGEDLALDDLEYGEGLVFHLSGQAGDLEVAYGRSCPVNIDEESVQDQSVHLYLSKVVKWGLGSGLEGFEVDTGALTQTPDGRAVLLGPPTSDRLLRFDPDLGAFSVLAIEPRATRRGGLRAVLADGRVLLVAGTDDSGDGTPFAELIDPRLEPGPAGRLEQVTSPRLRNPAAVALVDGSVLVLGGELQASAGAPFSATKAAWRFTFGDGGLLEQPKELLVTGNYFRAAHTATRMGEEIGADILLVGGRDEAGEPVAQAEIYRPLRENFELLANGILNVPRWGHRAVRMPGGSILILGGITLDSEGAEIPVATMELYDPVQGQFTTAGDLPSSAGLTEMALAALPDGRVLIAGGLDASGTAVDSTLIARLDSIDGRVDVSPTDSMASARNGHGAAALCDGTILIGGGAANQPAERYNPPSSNRR